MHANITNTTPTVATRAGPRTVKCECLPIVLTIKMRENKIHFNELESQKQQSSIHTQQTIKTEYPFIL